MTTATATAASAPATFTMYATVQRQHLIQALNQVLPAAARGGSLKALTGVRLHRTGEHLEVTATDLEISVTTRIPANGDPFTAVVPARLLAKLIRHTDGPIHLGASDDELNVRWGRSTAQLRTLPVDDWPRPFHINGLSVDVPAVDIERIKRIASFASTDDARPILTGVRLAGSEAVGTDSYRLAVARLDQPLWDDVALMPARVARFLPSTLLATEHARFTTDGVGLRIEVGEVMIETTLIAGEYPPYDRLLPTRVPSHLTFDRAELVDAVRAASVIADTTPVRFEVDGDVAHIRAVTQDVGTVVTDLAVTVDGDPPPATAAFNPAYLLGILGTVDGQQVTIDITDALKPVVVHEDPYTLLLMPVRVS